MLGGWSVSYAFTGSEGDETYIFRDTASRSALEDSLYTSTFEIERGGSATEGLVLWAADQPIGHEQDQGTTVAFYTPDRSQLASAQLLWLPHIVGGDAQQLPAKFSFDAGWSGSRFLVAETANGSLGWTAAYEFDEAPWPTLVEVTGTCSRSCPAPPGTWQRTAWEDGSGDVLEMGGSIPATWTRIPSSAPEQVPAIDPGGSATPLEDAVEAASGNDEVAAFQSRGDWWVQRATFDGHSVTGATTWHVRLANDADEVLDFTLEATMGEVEGVTQTYELSDIRQGTGEPVSEIDRGVPVLAESALVRHPCAGMPMSLATVLASWDSETSTMTQAQRGVQPFCEAIRVIVVYGLHGWPLLYSLSVDPV